MEKLPCYPELTRVVLALSIWPKVSTIHSFTERLGIVIMAA